MNGKRGLLLDLYCGEGAAAVGYWLAGWQIVGVDSDGNRGRYYPFTFIEGDAIEFLTAYGSHYDVIHASPPCQRYTHGNVTGTQAERHPDLIGPTRDALIDTGKPYIIENVPRAPLIDPIVLCGTMFDLTTKDDDGTDLYLRRHRLFEANFTIRAPRLCWHPPDVQWAGSYGGARNNKDDARNIRHGGYVPSKERQAELLGITWRTTLKGLQQAIPPAYTRWLGNQIP